MANKSSFHLALQLLFVIVAFSLKDGRVATGCFKAEREALLGFKAGVVDQNRRLSSWVGEDCCRWAGLHCDNRTGHVIRLKLREQPQNILQPDKYGLFGELSPSLLGLRHLRHLDLSWNCFDHGLFPKFLGSFNHLKYLDLSFSCFTGVVPHELGNISTLRFLYLSGIAAVFDDARWLSKLSSLQYLVLDTTNLAGVANLIQSLNVLPYLKYVSLDSCNLDSLPQSLPHLNFTRLSYLQISTNMFFGSSIPEWLFRIHSLHFLDMSLCSFGGTIPTSIGNASSLEYLDLSFNAGFSGDMPTTLGNLCNLKSLILREAFFNDTLEGFGDAFSGCISYSLNLLDLSNNQFGGPLPLWLGNLKNLTILDLSGNSHGGPIPAFLGIKLAHLQELNLEANALNGIIPESLGQLSKLISLDLNGNNFSSIITEAHLANLQSLKFLDFGKTSLVLNISFAWVPPFHLDIINLESCQVGPKFPAWLKDQENVSSLSMPNAGISDSMPSWLGNFKKLVGLDLSFNDIYGSIPESFGGLLLLQTLQLRSNALSGTIPTSVGQLYQLRTLDLSSNNFSSIITEAHMANLTRLKTLNFAWSDLVLNISSNWFPPFQLTDINLQSCYVGPKFPAWLENQAAISSLAMSGARISNSMPDWFWNISYTMVRLDLSHNNISGRLPPRLRFRDKSSVILLLRSNKFTGSLPYIPPNVAALDLFDNLLSGDIRPYFGDTSSQLFFLSLGSNALTGAIPSSLCNLSRLAVLDLATNYLTGVIPDCWNNKSALGFLNLANNKLHGHLPETLSSLQVFQVLDVTDNQLQGEFPAFLRNSTSLTTIALGINQFMGTIPFWVGETLSSLQILSLRGNNFFGDLPLLSNLSMLQILDLSHNDFSGTIPLTYGNFTGMMNGSLIGGGLFIYNWNVFVIDMPVITNGKELHFNSLLPYLRIMDLSSNNLWGQIPETLTNLIALKSLNLSWNHLSGEITEKIVLMQSLESLDLSENKLTGLIPSSMRALHFLHNLNLSYNNLAGEIPFGGQMTFTDPSIYAGNPYLCGFPLKNCTSGGPPTHDGDGKTLEHEGEEESEIFWMCMGIIPGLLVGFWTVFGLLLLKKTWRYAYFRHADNMYDMIYVKIAIIRARLKRKFLENRSK